MPITKTEFHTAVEQGVEDLMLRIHAFLSADKNLAYSERELKDRLGIADDRATQTAFTEALRALEGLEAVHWGIVGESDYYVYHHDLTTRPQRRRQPSHGKIRL